MSACSCGEVELGVAVGGLELPRCELAGVSHGGDRCYRCDTYGAPLDMELLTIEPAGELLEAGHAALVRPGDTMVISVDQELTMAEAEEYRSKVLEQIPGLADVVILAAAHVTAVYRPDDRPPATIDADGR